MPKTVENRPELSNRPGGGSEVWFQNISLEINLKHQSSRVIPLFTLSGMSSPSSLSDKLVFIRNSASLPLGSFPRPSKVELTSPTLGSSGYFLFSWLERLSHEQNVVSWIISLSKELSWEEGYVWFIFVLPLIDKVSGKSRRSNACVAVVDWVRGWIWMSMWG